MSGTTPRRTRTITAATATGGARTGIAALLAASGAAKAVSSPPPAAETAAETAAVGPAHEPEPSAPGRARAAA